MVKVKICGITNWPDARCAMESGADFLGFNFYSGSPRYIAPAAARRIVRRLPKKVVSVGVFVNMPEKKMLRIARTVGLGCLQLHGDESPEAIVRLERDLPVIKAVRVQNSSRVPRLARFQRATAVLLDGFDDSQRGGTGKTFPWSIVRRTKRNGLVFLAGGLTPENVGRAIRMAQPYAIDVCSGVEAKPGKKDPLRVKAFMRAVRATQGKER
jgi:phosphoribosylanthranilate isomerase